MLCLSAIVAPENPKLPSNWVDKLDSMRVKLLAARDDLKPEGGTNRVVSCRICSPLLAAASVPEGLASLPLAYTSDRPNMTLGDYLCLFTRLQTLQGVERADDATVSVNISNVALRFSPEKQNATDDFYAPPSSSTAGKVAYVIVQIGADGRSNRITNFNDNALMLDLLEAKFGAELVQ